MPEVKLTQGFVELETSKASVKVALHGATVVSWVCGGEERLFVSSKSKQTGPAAIRGGLPIVFPCFGPPPKEEAFSKLKQHGFARISKWEYAGEVKNLTGAEGVNFSLEPDSDIKELFQPDFKLLYSVIIENKTGALKTILRVNNPESAKQDLKYQTLLHTYIRLPKNTQLKDVKATGLKGLKYLDKATGAELGPHEETHESLTFPSEVDRVYFDAPDAVDLSFGLRVSKSAWPSFVTWNPDQKKSDALADMEEEGWKKYVCIEPGQAQDWFTLAPGESHEAYQHLEVTS